jgi:hypothetical protein
MPFRKSSLMDLTRVGDMADGWGKIVARRVHDQVGPDLDADDIEQIAMKAACAVAKGTIEELLEEKAGLLGAQQACPRGGQRWRVQREARSVDFWGAEVQYLETNCHCPACRPDFFSLSVWAFALRRTAIARRFSTRSFAPAP